MTLDFAPKGLSSLPDNCEGANSVLRTGISNIDLPVVTVDNQFGQSQEIQSKQSVFV